MLKFLKSLFANKIDDSDEEFRQKFEASHRTTNGQVDLSRKDGQYTNPELQEQWLEWVEYERSKITAW